MKPRVFISSTYYDLKHVRERIEKFIDRYGFESILFESDKVTYEHGKPIDLSVYNEVNLCHLMILIIGGRYGTAALGENISEEQKKYDNDFVSITRKEFETALKKDIPVFIFIDKNVYSEYRTYTNNYEIFEDKNIEIDWGTHKFKFAHVDSINVFRFVDTVVVKPIKTFERVEEIEYYLQNQIAGLFYLYLESLQKKKEVDKVLDTVTELNNISLRMNEMLNSVGKKILGPGNSEYEDVILKQFKMIVDFFGDQFYDSIDFEMNEEELKEIDCNFIAETIYEFVMDKEFEKYKRSPGMTRAKWIQEKDREIMEAVNRRISERYPFVILVQLNAVNLNSTYINKLRPFIKNDYDLMLVKERLVAEIEYLLF